MKCYCLSCHLISKFMQSTTNLFFAINLGICSFEKWNMWFDTYGYSYVNEIRYPCKSDVVGKGNQCNGEGVKEKSSVCPSNYYTIVCQSLLLTSTPGKVQQFIIKATFQHYYMQNVFLCDSIQVGKIHLCVLNYNNQLKIFSVLLTQVVVYNISGQK